MEIMMEEKKLLEYACMKFERKEYADALDAFILAYQKENIKGEIKDEILKSIYSCYMEPNEKTFHNNFEESICGDNKFYEQCMLDFIPYKEGEYYIFDKEKRVFEGIFSIKDFYNANSNLIFLQNESSDVVMECDWDYRNIKNVISGARERSIYIIAHDFWRALSFYKIPEFTDFFKDIKMFLNEEEYQGYFHRKTYLYLPKLIFGGNQFTKNMEEIYEQEHAYRLTQEGRNNERVLLTIGIPTHNRGNLLLKRLEHLKDMQYDAEIEVVVAKNGSALYQEEYKKASEIMDSRFIYYGTESELKPHQNWYNVVTRSHGKYILFVSDEDDVVLDALDHYLKLLSINSRLGQVRAKTSSEYALIEKKIGKKGLDAFEMVYLKQNYLSGLIVNRQMLIETDVMQYEKYWDNIFYKHYPHEWWCAALTQKGDSMTEPVLLIEEKEAVLEKEYEEYEKRGILKKETVFDKNCGLPMYATYESRFEQFQGQVKFLKIFMDNDIKGTQFGLKRSVRKLAFLLNVARSDGYKKEIYEQIIEKFVQLTMEAIDQFELNDRQQLEILVEIKQDCNYLIANNSQMG